MLIRTERLFIEPFTVDNPPPDHVIDKHIEWLNNKELMQFSEQRHDSHNKHSQMYYYDGYGRMLWNIRTDEPPTDTIGTITAETNEFNNIADLGIMIGFGFAGLGYGTEAYDAVSNWLLLNKFVRKVEGGCMSLNTGMIRIFEKSGFKQEGIREQHFLVNTGLEYGPISIDCLLFGKFFPTKLRA